VKIKQAYRQIYKMHIEKKQAYRQLYKMHSENKTSVSSDI